jgi:hypothetical protein
MFVAILIANDGPDTHQTLLYISNFADKHVKDFIVVIAVIVFAKVVEVQKSKWI